VTDDTQMDDNHDNSSTVTKLQSVKNVVKRLTKETIRTYNNTEKYKRQVI